MTIEVILFDNDWYHRMISQIQKGFGDDVTGDGYATATGVMIAGAFVGQAIDNAFRHEDGSTQNAIEDLAAAINRIGEAMEAPGVDSALRATLISPNVSDSNMEPANVVDVLNYLASAAFKIAHAITAPAAGGSDIHGGHIESLTEAVMGMTQSLANLKKE